MKPHAPLLCLGLLLIAAGATAQLDDGVDGIGVYFDMAATTNCHFTSGSFEAVTAYVCITNPSDPDGISGWEASILSTGPAVAPAWTLTAGLDVDGTAEGFQVGIGVTPLALLAAPAVVIATWSGYMMAPTDVQEFTIMDIPGSVSFAGTPGYGSGADAGVLIPLQASTGYPFTVCAQINACDIVAGEDMSWGEVKGLFR